MQEHMFIGVNYINTFGICINEYFNLPKASPTTIEPVIKIYRIINNADYMIKSVESLFPKIRNKKIEQDFIQKVKYLCSKYCRL